MFSAALIEKAKSLIDLCREKQCTITFAESCTGGLIASLITDISGASEVFNGSAVTYANEVKRDFIGVSQASLDAFGAVSEQVAREMAEGARRTFHANASAAVTGIAGPNGGSAEKPVGTVHIAAAIAGKTSHRHHIFVGNRQEVRLQTVEAAIDQLTALLSE